jgi:hypothetical protein
VALPDLSRRAGWAASLWGRRLDRRSSWSADHQTSIAIGILFLALCAIYLPDIGRGFIKDDFTWIMSSRVERPADLFWFFARDAGFYRPLVTLTFAADRFLFGLEPLGYGGTNFALLLLGAGCLVGLGRRLGMSAPASTVAGAVWAFNFHGVNMAVLWISGRTALLLTVCAIAAAIAVLKGHRVAAGFWTLLALLAKEEAVALPLTLGVWAWLFPDGRATSPGPSRLRHLVARIWPLAVALGLYLGLRAWTAAYLPWSAPIYYRFTIAPGTVLRNVLEYLDRSSTLAAAVVVLACLAAGQRPSLTDRQRRWALAGGVWLIGGFALTTFLPVRSSLYALFPAVGAAIMAGAVVSALEPVLATRVHGRLVWLALLLPLVCLPVYRARNVRWTALGDVSTSVLATIDTVSRGLPARAAIVLLDDSTSRANLASAFGTAIQHAVELRTGRPRHVWIEPPVPHAALAGLHRPRPQDVGVVLQLRDGRLIPVSEPKR